MKLQFDANWEYRKKTEKGGFGRFLQGDENHCQLKDLKQIPKRLPPR